MKSDNSGSAANSAETSNRPDTKPSAPKSESEFLAEQSDLAKNAMSDVVSRMGESLKAGANVPAWVSEYPWISVGAAATVGFIAASALTPSREESFKERLKSLLEEVKSHPATQAVAEATPQGEKAAKSKSSTMLKKVIESLASVAASSVSAAISAKMRQHQAAGANGNGNGNVHDYDGQTNPGDTTGDVSGNS